MKVLRKKAAELGISTPQQDSPAKSTTPSTNKNKRAAPTTPTSANKKARGKKGALSSPTVAPNDDDDGDVGGEEVKNNPKTPINLSSDEAEGINTRTAKTPSKNAVDGDNASNNVTANGDGDGDEISTTPAPTPSSKRKASTAKPRVPRTAKSTTAKPKANSKANAKKEALTSSFARAIGENGFQNGGDGGVEMEFVKEEEIAEEEGIKVEEVDKDGQDGHGVGVGVGVGVGEEDGQEKGSGKLSNGYGYGHGGVVEAYV